MSKFIEDIPSLVLELNRPTFGTTAAGGKTVTSTEVIGEQRFGIMPFKRRLTQEFSLGPQIRGRNQFTDIHYILVCQPDADIQQEDWFIWEGVTDLAPGRYEVSFVGARSHDHKLVPIRFRGPSES